MPTAAVQAWMPAACPWACEAILRLFLRCCCAVAERRVDNDPASARCAPRGSAAAAALRNVTYSSRSNVISVKPSF